jgi:hypothetical protein
MITNVSDFIKKSLDYYDKQNNKYKKYLPKNTELLLEEKQIIDFKTKKKIANIEFQVLGVFHNKTNIFIWSWVLPYLSIDLTKTSRELLDYGLKLEPQTNNINHYYIKSLLINSRIYIENDINLELIQAISAYLLKDKLDFIYEYKFGNKSSSDIFLTTYYLIKISND